MLSTAEHEQSQRKLDVLRADISESESGGLGYDWNHARLRQLRLKIERATPGSPDGTPVVRYVGQGEMR